MHKGFHSLFWDKEQPPISFQWSPKEYMDYEKENKGRSFLKKGCNYFS